MSDNELQAKLSIQLGQALAALKQLGGELRTVKANITELSTNTNRLQQESSKTTKTQVEGAQAAGKATKTYNDLVNEQAKRLQDARIKAAALADAQRMLGHNAPKRILAPTVEEFRALDQAKAATLGLGRAQQDMLGMSGIGGMTTRFMGLAAAATLALKLTGDLAQRYRELEDRAVKNNRTSGAAALTIEQAMQSSGATDAAGLTEEALTLKGPFNQEAVTAFVNQVVQRNPDVDDTRWRTLFDAFTRTATTPGASQTLANLSSLAPDASADQLARMTNEYTRASGGRAMDETAARQVQGLAQTGFFTHSEAMAMVSSLSAYDRGGEADALIAKLSPPKQTGNPVEDAAAQEAWWNSVGYLKGQPAGARHAIAAVAPALAADLRSGPLGKRVDAAGYRLTSAVDPNSFAPRGNRAAYEVEAREQDRFVETSSVMDEDGMARARAAADSRAAVEWRKNKAAAGDRGAMRAEMLDAAQKSLPFNAEEFTRPLVNSATAPPVPTRPVQVEIVRDTTIRPLTY